MLALVLRITIELKMKDRMRDFCGLIKWTVLLGGQLV